jgi:hypothetical protein
MNAAVGFGPAAIEQCGDGSTELQVRIGRCLQRVVGV